MVTNSKEHFAKVILLFRLPRPYFLIPGVLLFTLGALLAIANGAAIEPGLFIFGYAIFFFAHLSVPFSNDYFDQEADKAAQRTSVSGGSGVLIEHPEMAPLALMMAILLIALSVATAMAFTWYYSYPLSFLAYAVLGGLLGWFYTAPPLRLAYRGLGEATTALASGFIMPGMGYFVISGTIDMWFVIFSFPIICYGLYFILTVEMPDIESDRSAGKVNLLVDRGLGTGTKVALLGTAAATAFLFTIAYTGVLGTTIDFWYLAWFSLLPLAISGYGTIRDLRQRRQVLSQVKLNFVGIMSFLLFFITVSVATVWLY
jgi:1,4-dihydroxy-2-naphthoate polyprenyltransferase